MKTDNQRIPTAMELALQKAKNDREKQELATMYGAGPRVAKRVRQEREK